MADSDKHNRLLQELRALHGVASDLQRRLGAAIAELEGGADYDPARTELARRAIEELRQRKYARKQQSGATAPPARRGSRE